MSAIAAILRFDGEPVISGEIEGLAAAMSARGPDGRVTWQSGSVALGHGMLHGTRESLAEVQPLVAADGRFRMIWDGRLDNRDELRRALDLQRVVTRDDTDPELVLQMFVLHGDRTPERLLGDFAFAVWDEVEQRLFCARDQVGARPFYYVLNDHFFALASEDEALLILPGVSREPCEDRLIYALVPSFDAFDWQQSWLRDVRILMPGTRLTIDVSRRLRKDRYWQMVIPDIEATSVSQATYQSEFAEIFSRAVSDRMRTHHPVAAMMSGGMDSASICAMATRLVRERGVPPLNTFSAIEDDIGDCLESQSILQMASRLGLNAALLRVPSFTGFASRADLEEIARRFVHPTDASLSLVAMMCLGASRGGHRVLLHGATGDVATHTPLPYLATVLRDEGARAALRELKLSSTNHTYLAGLGIRRIVAQNVYRCLTPRLLEQARIAVQERFGSGRNRWSLLAPGFVQSRNLIRRVAQSRMAALATSDDARREHLAAMFPVGVVRGLEGYERVAGHFGLEMRDPWADRRVLEFMLRAPVSARVGGGWTKLVARREFEPDLGAEVVWRSDKPHLGWRFDHDYSQDRGIFPPAHVGSVALSELAAAGSAVHELVDVARAWLSRISRIGQ